VGVVFDMVDGERGLARWDRAVADWGSRHATDRSIDLLDRLTDLLAFLLPRYRKEHRSYLSIAIGCTGGRHRSVGIAEALQERLAAIGQPVRVVHRDAER
ncbi:MAG TPA: RNase adapter RapZ, partial [Thermoanaerobaculia bacterium]